MIADASRTLRIRTPEGVVFALPLAGPIQRGLALAIDLACISALGSIIGKALFLLDFLEAGVGRAVAILLYFVLSIGYGIACEWSWKGQTVGKRLLRLQVVDEEGLPLTFSQVALRNLIRILDALPIFYLVGGISCYLTRYGQRLGDIAARTVVISHRRIEVPDVESLLPGKFNSFLAHPHLAARLRQKTSAAQAALVLQALLRRDSFTPEARLRIYAELRAAFAESVAFPASATDDLIDEQYLRNVVQILFQKSKKANP